MDPAASRLDEVLERVLPSLHAIDETRSQWRYGEGKWSKRELLGHLIDSAANNHQRFVRLQLQDEIRLPGYEADAWVNTQCYHERSWGQLLALWEAYNRHLVHVLTTIAPQHTTRRWHLPDESSHLLRWIMDDYVDHLLHHLGQILETSFQHRYGDVTKPD
jgi:hypothetical protein